MASFIGPDLPTFIATSFITAGPGYAVANMRFHADCLYFFSNVSVSMFLVDLLEYNLLASYLDQGPKNVPQNALRTLSFLPTSTSRCSSQPSLR